jgi:hypothetical protein
MGKTTGFMEHSRELAPRRPVTQRINDWFEIYLDLPEEKLRSQGARCMDCGVPFCQTGCPVNNLIPDSAGKKPPGNSTRPTIFPNSRGGFVPHRVKRRVCWGSTSRQ